MRVTALKLGDVADSCRVPRPKGKPRSESLVAILHSPIYHDWRVVAKGGQMTVEGIRGSSDRSVLVLTSLAGGPRHGYGLIKDIEAFAGVKLSRDVVRMPRQAGTSGGL